MEERLVAIWTEILGLDRVGMCDSFFEMGGHSLLATQLLARVQRNFDVELPLRLFFEAPTIAGLATSIMMSLAERAGVKAVTHLLAELDRLAEHDLAAGHPRKTPAPERVREAGPSEV
jgi:acyl carrier protein